MTHTKQSNQNGGPGQTRKRVTWGGSAGHGFRNALGLVLLGSSLGVSACAVAPTPAEPTPVYADGLPQGAEPVPVERVSINEPEAKAIGSSPSTNPDQSDGPKSGSTQDPADGQGDGEPEPDSESKPLDSEG